MTPSGISAYLVTSHARFFLPMNRPRRRERYFAHPRGVPDIIALCGAYQGLNPGIRLSGDVFGHGSAVAIAVGGG